MNPNRKLHTSININPDSSSSMGGVSLSEETPPYSPVYQFDLRLTEDPITLSPELPQFAEGGAFISELGNLDAGLMRDVGLAGNPRTIIGGEIGRAGASGFSSLSELISKEGTAPKSMLPKMMGGPAEGAGVGSFGSSVSAGIPEGSPALQRVGDSPTRGMGMPTPTLEDVQNVLRSRRGSVDAGRWETLSDRSRKALSEASEALPCEERVKQRIYDMLPTEENLQAMADEGGMMGNIARVLNNVLVKNINRALDYPYVRGGLIAFTALLTPTIMMQIQSVRNYLFSSEAVQEIDDNKLSSFKKSINQTIEFINAIYGSEYNDNATQSFINKIALLNKSQKELNKNGNVNTTIPGLVVDELMKGFFSAVKQEHIKKKAKRQTKNWGRDKVHIPIRHTAYGEPQLPGS